MPDIIRREPDVAHRDPFGIGPLRHAMDRLFDDSFFRSPSLTSLDEGSLELDVSEKEGKLVVRASLPGFSKDEIEVQIHEGVLSIKAEHSEEREEEGERFYRRERCYGAVSRRVALPGVVADADVDGELKNGVLTLVVDIPRKAQAKKIELKEG